MPASYATDLFIRHGELIGRLPQDVPDPVDNDDEVWIEAITAGPERDEEDDGCDDHELYDDD